MWMTKLMRLIVGELVVQVPTLTNEGGILKRDRRLQRGVDYEIVPESLWKALALWYGKGTFALPRTVSCLSLLHSDPCLCTLSALYTTLLRQGCNVL